MDVRELEYAVSLAEELHFGRAARRHFISEQPFGRRIRELERELGVALFARTSRRVSLTAAGAAFIPRARRVLEALDEMAGLNTDTTRETGTVRIGMLGFGGGSIWPQVRDRVAPGYALSYHEVDFTTHTQALADGLVDVAVIQYLEPVPGIVFDELFASPRVAVVPRGSALAARRRLSAQDLTGHEWVGIDSSDPGMQAWAGRDPVHRAQISVSNPASIPTVVAATGAIGLHAEEAAHHLPHPGVRFIPVDGEPMHIALASRENDTRSGVSALRDAVNAVAATPSVHG